MSNTAVDFDADTFLDTLRSMLQDNSDTKVDEDESDNSLSISDDDEGTSEVRPEEELEDEGREVEELMAKMDEELAMTSVGKSFEKEVGS